MRFHVPAAACQLSSRPLLAGQSSSRGAADKVKYSAARSHLACRPAGLFSLTLLLLLSHLAGSGAGGGGASSRRLGSQGGAPTALSGHLCHSESGPDLDPQTVARLLESLVTVPHDEVGEVALCASLRNEGRFIVEWLLYVSSRVYSRWLRGRRRAPLHYGTNSIAFSVSTGSTCKISIDLTALEPTPTLRVAVRSRYDSGSDDDTLEKLQPWLRAGTVKLHRFRHDQRGHYQTTALETCSRTYGPLTEWLVEADCDEFYVIIPTLTALTRTRRLDVTDMPERPLALLLSANWLYKNADAVAVSRVTWKNAGIDHLPPDASVLATQTLREYQHSVGFEKNFFTKSLLHTRQKDTGWVIPGAHFLRNTRVPVGRAKVITANGQSVTLDPFPAQAKDTEASGTQYAGTYSGNRVFEPIVLYHYVQRDLQDCYRKLKVAQKLRKGGWRDKAGSAGCTSYVVYEAGDAETPIHDQNGFFGAALRDVGMAESWFGRYLPLLIAMASEEAAALVRDEGQVEARIEPHVVDPHPDLVAQWKAQGLNPENGMPI